MMNSINPAVDKPISYELAKKLLAYRLSSAERQESLSFCALVLLAGQCIRLAPLMIFGLAQAASSKGIRYWVTETWDLIELKDEDIRLTDLLKDALMPGVSFANITPAPPIETEQLFKRSLFELANYWGWPSLTGEGLSYRASPGQLGNRFVVSITNDFFLITPNVKTLFTWHIPLLRDANMLRRYSVSADFSSNNFILWRQDHPRIFDSERCLDAPEIVAHFSKLDQCCIKPIHVIDTTYGEWDGIAHLSARSVLFKQCTTNNAKIIDTRYFEVIKRAAKIPSMNRYFTHSDYIEYADTLTLLISYLQDYPESFRANYSPPLASATFALDLIEDAINLLRFPTLDIHEALTRLFGLIDKVIIAQAPLHHQMDLQEVIESTVTPGWQHSKLTCNSRLGNRAAI